MNPKTLTDVRPAVSLQDATIYNHIHVKVRSTEASSTLDPFGGI